MRPRESGPAAAVIGMMVAACGGRGQPTAFLVSPEQFFTATHVVALAPVRPPSEVTVDEPGLSRLDTLLGERLRDAGFEVVSSTDYAEIWQAVLERVGGIDDPQTGAPDESRLATARLQLADELELAFGADAIVYPELWVEEVPFTDGQVEWNGVSESVVRTGPAIVGTVLAALAAIGDHDADADLPSGTVSALSLYVFIEDLGGVETYRRAGGIRLLEKMGWHEDDWSPVDAQDILGDEDRNRRAVAIALGPLGGR